MNATEALKALIEGKLVSTNKRTFYRMYRNNTICLLSPDVPCAAAVLDWLSPDEFLKWATYTLAGEQQSLTFEIYNEDEANDIHE